MSIKAILKLFVPPLIYVIKEKIIKENKTDEGCLRSIARNTEKIVIIGNGPSLSRSIELYYEEIMKYDRLAANYFAASDLYTSIKPNKYAFADPMFFKEKEKLGNSVLNLIKHIKDDTMWDMEIYIPSDCINSYFCYIISENQHIKFTIYNTRNIASSQMDKFVAWDKNLSCPPAMNVLNIAVYLSLFAGYSETYLIGADTSFLTNLRIDQKTNQLYSIETHFYNNEEIYKNDDFLDKSLRRPIKEKLHEELHCIEVALKNYWDLKAYADYKGLKVYNASEYSWVDAFERKKLS